MTGRERLETTFKGKKADRMPISPFIYYNNIYEMFKYKPDINKHLNPDDFDLAEKYVEYHDFFGWDVLFALGLLWDSYIPETAANWDVTITREGDQDKQKRTTLVKTPDGELKQVMKFDRSSTYLVVFAVEKYLIETKEDFEIFRKYAPPADFINCDLMRRAKEAVGDKGLVNVATHGAFNTLNQFRKLDTMMIDPVVDEVFYREMMDFFLDWNAAHLKEVAAAGSDSIEIGGNMATSAVGPQFFTDYVRDYENKLCRKIHEAGAHVVYHNCGDAQTIMHLYNDMDIDVWGYITTAPFGDVILEDALSTIRPDMALRGNIDQVEFLRKATTDEVKQRVKELIDKVKERGNWILCTSDFPFDETPYENLHALTEAGLKYGKY
jgi:uroporphyrinogen decarboxylase